MIINPYRFASSSYSPPLDSYTSNLKAAWSVSRLLLTSYSGSSIIRIRRSNDSTEQDIGTSSGLLDTAAITTFVGSNSAYIVKIYDQSGGGFVCHNATTSAQPRIVNAGTLDTCGGVPCGLWDGAGDNLPTTLTKADVRQYSVILQNTNSTWPEYTAALEAQSDAGSSGRLGCFAQSSTSWHTDPVIAGCRKNGTALTANAYNMTTINVAMVLGVDTASPSNTPTGALTMGAMGTRWFGGKIAELIAWSNQSSRSGFEANQKTFIGL